MKIVELKSSNIKKLKVVELQLDEKKNVVMITGRNGQGKTSILDSIWYALGGKKAVQDKPIRDGQEAGEIDLNLDGYIVKRTFTEKGSYLTVNNKDGEKYSNPQQFLDYIIGNLSFDPLEFSRLEGKKQIAELSTIVGIDLAVFDEKKKKLTEDRVFIGRDMKALGSVTEEALTEAIKLKDSELISVADLSAQLSKESEKHTAFLRAQDHIQKVKGSIIQAQEDIKKAQINIENYRGEIKSYELVKDTEVDGEALKIKIDNAETENNKIREAKTVIETSKKIELKKKEYDAMTLGINDVDEEKKTKLSTAKMPIEGLSWEDDKVLYNKIPYDQISAAEQLRVSMAIAMASNPKLKVILIRDGSLLDNENMKVIEEMAKDKDFQVWIEAVQNDGKVGFHVEDGSIKSIDGVSV